jgi:rhodanese-related sulfurtransferase
MKPLSCDPAKLKGLSERLIVSHYENNYGGAVKRLNAIAEQIGTLDFSKAPVFLINGLKREELIRCQHEQHQLGECRPTLRGVRAMSRTIAPSDLKPLVESNAVTVLDVRRQADFDADQVKLPGAQWKNPEQMAAWSQALPKDREVVIYCVRGGSVSNSVLDRLLGQGIRARFIEGGIEAWKAAGGVTVGK